MHILCTSDLAFMKHSAAMLASVATNNARVTAHWIYSGMAQSDIDRLSKFFQSRGMPICFYPAPLGITDGLPVDKHASVANYFRLMAPSLLPASIDRVLYLDADLIVRKDLTQLWRHDMGTAPVAAVFNPSNGQSVRKLGIQPEDYFNSGVMLLDLRRWRETNLGTRVLQFIGSQPDRITYWDQDGLNGVLRGDWSRLPATWNAMHSFFLEEELRAAYLDEIRDPAIVHFSGQGLKPWQYALRHPFKDEYRKYRRQTPWPRYREDGKPPISAMTLAYLRRIGVLRTIKSSLKMHLARIR